MTGSISGFLHDDSVWGPLLYSRHLCENGCIKSLISAAHGRFEAMNSDSLAQSWCETSRASCHLLIFAAMWLLMVDLLFHTVLQCAVDVRLVVSDCVAVSMPCLFKVRRVELVCCCVPAVSESFLQQSFVHARKALVSATPHSALRQLCTLKWAIGLCMQSNSCSMAGILETSSHSDGCVSVLLPFQCGCFH